MAGGKLYKVKASKKVNTMMARPSWEKVATVKTVKRIVNGNIETKIYDNNFGFSGGSWSIYCLSNILEGDAVDNRSGNKVTPTHLSLRTNIGIAGTNTSGDQVRMVLFKDKQARGALPSTTDLGLTNILSHFLKKDNYQGRFVKMYDRVFQYDTSQRNRFISINKKLSGKLQFGTEGDKYENNAIFLAVCSQIGADDKSEGLIYSRLRFKDA
jgi:hypothetical protein